MKSRAKAAKPPDGKAHHMLTRETIPGGALSVAWGLLETRPSDIWIETENGRRVASYADIVEDGPALVHASGGLSRTPPSGRAKLVERARDRRVARYFLPRRVRKTRRASF